MLKKFLLGLLTLIAGNVVLAQYTLNGNASQNDCHCYTLTPDALAQSGSVWNDNKINLNQSFDFKFDIFLGCADPDGADGIAFVLQPISTSVGAQGGGLGYSGVMPAVGVTIDTWQNGSPSTTGPDGDPAYDHISIQLNGDLDHKDSIPPLPVNNIAGPVTALAGNDNIEDCNWHILRIQWNATTKTLSAFVDGILRLEATMNIVAEVFNNDPMVFWGFTGSTGGAKNLQQVCTALKPIFKVLPGQKKCIGERISFFDSTISFAPIRKFYWDFGDGSPLDSVNLNPVHSYRLAGNYTIVQTVTGADGCTEKNTQQLVIGSKPVADFTFNNACESDGTINFTNTSSAAFGTINTWFWDLGEAGISLQETAAASFSSPGFRKIRLAVKSLEGCESDTIAHVVQVYEKPKADLLFVNDQCSNVPVRFSGISTVADGRITDWMWDFDSTGVLVAQGQNPTHVFDRPGRYTVLFNTRTNNGCLSDTISRLVDISPGPVANFTHSNPCLGAPVAFKDSSYSNPGNPVTGWWWNLGNGNTSTAKDPRATYGSAGEFTISLVATSVNGCPSDTIKRSFSIESKPTAEFSHTSPACENTAFVLSDSSTIGSGTVQQWYWRFHNGDTSLLQNPTTILAAGNHPIKLVVKNGNGCNSDTATRFVFVNRQPVIDFETTDACKDATVSFSAAEQAGERIDTWKWTFHDGASSTSKDTQRVYSAAGIFPVELTAVSNLGCADTATRNTTIYATRAFAGNDTIAAVNQPVQLMASGGTLYEWSPARGLTDRFIRNPVATISSDQRYIVRAFTPVGCESYDTVTIKVYDGPEIYVPTAFSPNNDGRNEILKALPVGTVEFRYFTIYNRLGQVVFTTSNPNTGWDGSFGGKAQHPGVYVWIASAVGLYGNILSRKGTVMLLR